MRFLVNPSFDPLDHSLLLPSAEHGAHAAIRDIAAPDADGDSIGLLGGKSVGQFLIDGVVLALAGACLPRRDIVYFPVLKIGPWANPINDD